jgi:hypothetical protein
MKTWIWIVLFVYGVGASLETVEISNREAKVFFHAPLSLSTSGARWFGTLSILKNHSVWVYQREGLDCTQDTEYNLMGLDENTHYEVHITCATSNVYEDRAARLHSLHQTSFTTPHKILSFDSYSVSDTPEAIVSLQGTLYLYPPQQYEGRLECRGVNDYTYRYQKPYRVFASNGIFRDHIHPRHVLNVLETQEKVLMCRMSVRALKKTSFIEYHTPSRVLFWD